MHLQFVLERFALLAGMAPEEMAPWEPVVEEAYQELLQKTKGRKLEDTKQRQLDAAAAALAFYRYTQYRLVNEAGSFTAGDVRLEGGKEESVRMAQQLWLQSKAQVSDVLEDDDFLFRRMGR